MTAVILVSPDRTDLNAILELVAGSGLPCDGIADQFPNEYVVARSGSVVVGVAGLERHGRSGLLRSLAVHPAHRRSGLGARLVQDRLEQARAKGLEAVYLLTTTAPDYFRRLGFEEELRAAAPAELQDSSEFASICPASAVCLVKKLS